MIRIPSTVRLCARSLLLVLLATVRGVYCLLEQPQSSTMRYFPDMVAVGEMIQKLLGPETWQSQFLWGPKCDSLIATLEMQSIFSLQRQFVCTSTQLDGILGSTHFEGIKSMGNGVHSSMILKYMLHHVSHRV